MSQKRILIFLGLIFIIFFVVIVQLFSSQIINNSYYLMQAQKYATRIELIAEPRGKIIDRNGNILVSNKLSFDLFITPSRYLSGGQDSLNILSPSLSSDKKAKEGLEQSPPQPETTNKLSSVLGIKPDIVISKIKAIHQRIISQAEGKSESEMKRFIKQQYRNKYKLFSGLTVEQVIQIESHPEIFTGLSVSETISRHYLYNELACHITGYIGPVWKEEYDKFVENNYFVNMLSQDVDENTYQALVDMGEFKDEFIGRSGVEKSCNNLLTGKYAVRLSEYDYTNKQRQELSRTKSVEPVDIMLTIDLPLQKKVEEALKNKVGAAIVMDVRNGEILAMASSPSFNPNHLQPPIDKGTTEYISKSPLKPLYNRATSGEYALGSVFKIITAVAALEEGKITPYTPFYCNGYFSSSYKKFRCWIVEHNREHGSLSLEDAFKQSCNVFFFNAGKLAGGEAITKWADKMGFGHLTNIDLPAERRGRLPKPITGTPAQGEKEPKWSLSETLNLSIGQGDLMVTPLQVVRMMAAIANGGNILIPRIIRTTTPDNTKPPSIKITLSPDTIKHIKNGLYKVVHSEGGTAYGTKLRDFPVAGKTSTAEVDKHRSHGWFSGFAPYDKPQIAFVVVVEHGGKGSEVAAPIAASFLPEALAIKSSDK